MKKSQYPFLLFGKFTNRRMFLIPKIKTFILDSDQRKITSQQNSTIEVFLQKDFLILDFLLELILMMEIVFESFVECF